MESTSKTQGGEIVGTQYPCVVLVLAACLGITFDRQLDWTGNFYLCCSGVMLVVWFVTWILGWTRVASVGLCLLLAGLASLSHHAWWNWFQDNEISLCAESVPNPVVIELDSIAEPRRMSMHSESPFDPLPAEPRTFLRCQAVRIRDGQLWRDVSGAVDVYVRGDWRTSHAGDRLFVIGQLTRIEQARNPGEFDFYSHFRGQRRLAVLYVDFPEAIRVEAHTGNWLTRVRATLRENLDRVIWEKVPAEHAGLASAVLLGNRQQLTDSQRDLFMLSSTIHVLSISGLHVGILACLLFWMMRFGFVERRTCLIAVAVLIFFYAWLVEFSAPVTRSAVLIGLYCLRRYWGRVGKATNLLACAGLIVLAINPTDLFGVGPQLSFLAVLTMISSEAYLKKSVNPLSQLVFATRPWPVRCLWWCWDKTKLAFLLSGLIWIVALPIVVDRYQVVSPIGLLVNPLILIPMSIAMYCGMIVLVGGWLIPGLGHLAGYLCSVSLGVMVDLVTWSTQVPGGYWWVVGPPAIAIAAYYIGVWLFFLLPGSRLSFKWLAAVGAVWFAVGWAIPLGLHRSNSHSVQASCELTVVDVGHGLSSLIHLPDGRYLLFDAGSFGSSAVGVKSVGSVLWSQQIEHLDAVVISHADLDHFNALPELCHRFSIGVVYISPQMLEHESEAVVELLRQLQLRHIPVRAIHSGTRLLCGGGCHVDCLGPPYFGTGGSDNSNSVVLSLTWGQRRVLFTGDLEGPGMEFLLRQQPLDCDVILAPHHGSLSSRPDAIFEWARPELVLVSGSAKRTDPRSILAYETEGAKVLTTGQLGALKVTITPTDIHCVGHLEGPE